jgi:hypothetical protein
MKEELTNTTKLKVLLRSKKHYSTVYLVDVFIIIIIYFLCKLHLIGIRTTQHEQKQVPHSDRNVSFWLRFHSNNNVHVTTSDIVV